MRRLIHCPDGRVRIMVFATDDAALIDRDTKAMLAENPGSVFEDIEESALPQTRRFRNCWTRAVSGGVAVDLDKAKAQRLDEIRAERDTALAASDGQLLRDQEQGKDVTALLASRQALRDLPAVAEADLAKLNTADAIAAYSVDAIVADAVSL